MNDFDLQLPARDESKRPRPFRPRHCTGRYDQTSFGHEALDHGLFDTFPEDDMEGPGKADYNRGVIAYERGDIDEAVACFRAAIEAAPSAVAARNNLALCHIQQGNTQQGLEQLLAILRDDPENHHVLRNAGVVHSMTGDNPQALRFLEQASEIEPEDTDLLFLRARIYDQISAGDKAVECMVRAAELEPESCSVFDNLGVVLHGAGRLDDAIAAFDHAIRLDPDQALPHYNRARALAAAGRLDDAIAGFTRHLELEPDHSCAVYDLARALSEHGKHDPALERFQEYAALEPEDPQGHCSLGVELMLTGKLEQAEAPIRESLRLDPWFDWAVGSLGSLADFREKWALAEAFYREALARDPELDSVRSRWIRMLCMRISLAAALQELRDHPHRSDIGNWAALMDWLNANDRKDDAITVGREMVGRFGDQHWIHGCFALCLADAGQPDEALKELREAVRLNPDDLIAHFHTSRLLCDARRYKEALPVLEFVLSKDPGSIDALRTISFAHAMLDHTADAQEYARRVIEIDPSDAFAREVLGLPDESESDNGAEPGPA